MRVNGPWHSWLLNGGSEASPGRRGTGILPDEGRHPRPAHNRRHDMTRSTKIIAALAAALATSGTVAFPAYAAEGKVSAVSYADLDLASADGAASLKKRVERAARDVCTFEGDRSLDGAMEAKACAKVATARAMPQVELALAKAGTQLADNGRITVAAH
ncbi:UrcA family protein [Sphingomonas histidinilytica]|nr:UrcA family protein [Rhizorhabdus histidinilytica]